VTEIIINNEFFSSYMADEFRCFGMTVPRIAVFSGGFLTIWGVISYFLQSADPPSLTAMIPAAIGFPMVALGILSELDSKNRHHYMHGSMFFALLMVIGGFRVFSEEGMTSLAIMSHLFLIGIGTLFIFVGIKSFRHARLKRESMVNE